MVEAFNNDRCAVCEAAWRGWTRVYAPSDGVLFAVCASCGAAMRTRPKDIAPLYDDHYSEAITRGFRTEGNEQHAEFTLRALEPLTAVRRSLLDIGCAGGDFLDEVRRQGWRVRGVERQSRSAGIAREKGLTVYSPSIAEIPEGETFDVVTLLDVFEHIREPRAFLRQLSPHMNAGAILYIDTPNFGSLFRRLLGRRWIAFVPFHEILYTPFGLSRLLEQEGFTVQRRFSYACGVLSYDGLRRLRVHRPFYDAAALAAGALRRLGWSRFADRLGAGSAGIAISRFINWPMERLLGHTLLKGDQLVIIAQRALRPISDAHTS